MNYLQIKYRMMFKKFKFQLSKMPTKYLNDMQ